MEGFVLMTSVEYVFSFRNYNIYKTEHGQYITVFSDQPELLHFISSNYKDSVFLLRFLKEDNIKRYYRPTEDIKAYTLAEAFIVTEEQQAMVRNTHMLKDKLY